METAAYDEPVAEFWRAILGRFVESTRERLESDPAFDLPAEQTAFLLCWMTERACYQQIVQGRDLADPDFVTALVSLWERGTYGRLPTD